MTITFYAQTGGFFIETGAYDGEQMSNTLLLERSLGWRGLLIEPSRTLFPRLVAKHRRAWALHACCSQTGAPFQVGTPCTCPPASGQ